MAGASPASPAESGSSLHYAVLAGLIAVLLWAIVPRAIDQVDNALGGIPTSSSELERQTSQSTGFKHEILARVQDGLDELPSGAELVDSSLSLTFTAFEVAGRRLLHARMRGLLDLRA